MFERARGEYHETCSRCAHSFNWNQTAWLSPSQFRWFASRLVSEQLRSASKEQEKQQECGGSQPEKDVAGQADVEARSKAVARAPGSRGSDRFHSIGVVHRSPATGASGADQAAYSANSPAPMQDLDGDSNGGIHAGPNQLAAPDYSDRRIALVVRQRCLIFRRGVQLRL